MRDAKATDAQIDFVAKGLERTRVHLPESESMDVLEMMCRELKERRADARMAELERVFGIVANGGAFQVIDPPHHVEGMETIDQRIYVVRESDLPRALRYAHDKCVDVIVGAK